MEKKFAVNRLASFPANRRSRAMTIKKRGGIWFLRIGRIGFNFYVSKRKEA